MNIEDTSKVLAMIALLENRKFTDEQIAAWQLILRDIDFQHASQAVTKYYQNQTEQIKPAHIYRLAKDIKVESGKRVYGNLDS